MDFDLDGLVCSLTPSGSVSDFNTLDDFQRYCMISDDLDLLGPDLIVWGYFVVLP